MYNDQFHTYNNNPLEVNMYVIIQAAKQMHEGKTNIYIDKGLGLGII